MSNQFENDSKSNDYINDQNQEQLNSTLSYEYNYFSVSTETLEVLNEINSNQYFSGSAETLEVLNEINFKVTQEILIDELFDDINLYYFQYYKSYKNQIFEKLFDKKYQLVKKRESYELFCEYFYGYLLFETGEQQEYNFKIYFDKPQKDFEKEVEIMKTFEDLINVVKIVDSIQTEHFHILVLEKYQYTLREELELFIERKEIFSFNKLIKIIFDLLLGLIELKRNHTFHLHIKPGNIFKSKQGHYCYADFEASHNIKKHTQINIQYYTIAYVFPEFDDQKSIDYSSDLYSLGKVLLHVINDFKEIHLDYLQNKQLMRKTIQSFEKIIQENMILEKSSERSKCQDLPQLFLQQIQYPQHEIDIELQSLMDKVIINISLGNEQQINHN